MIKFSLIEINQYCRINITYLSIAKKIKDSLKDNI